MAKVKKVGLVALPTIGGTSAAPRMTAAQRATAAMPYQASPVTKRKASAMGTKMGNAYGVIKARKGNAPVKPVMAKSPKTPTYKPMSKK